MEENVQKKGMYALASRLSTWSHQDSQPGPSADYTKEALNEKETLKKENWGSLAQSAIPVTT